MQQLSPQDAMFVYMETPHTPLQLGWLNIYDPATAPGGKVRFKSILSHVEQRLHTVRFFRQRLVRVPGDLDHPYWVEDEGFDLEYHVRHIALPAPGDWRQLCILVARLFAQPFDATRPLWEFYVIEGLDQVEGFPKGSFALLAKMHHAAIDGISGVDVTTFLHTPQADTPPPPPHAWEPEPVPGAAELLARSTRSKMANRGGLVKTVGKLLPGLKRLREARAAGELPKAQRRKVARTRFSGSVGPHRVIEARRFELAAIRRIRALAPGSTVNDVLLAIVAGAMRRYLLAHDDLPDGTLIATCPISVRTEAEKGQLGNQVANMIVPLATDVDDAVERLARIHGDTVNAKGVTDAIGARTLAEVSQLLPGTLMGLGVRLHSELALADRLAGVANTTVTNVPGPQSPLYLAGARMVSEFVLGPVLQGMGLFHAVLSYCGEITLTAVADRDKLPDPAFYAQCIQDSYDELEAAAAPPDRPAAARRPRGAAPAKPRPKRGPATKRQPK